MKRVHAIILWASLITILACVFNAGATTEIIDGKTYITGTIDRIGDHVVVVDDMLFRFSENIQFLSSSGKEIDRGQFSRGLTVVINIDENRKVLSIRRP